MKTVVIAITASGKKTDSCVLQLLTEDAGGKLRPLHGSRATIPSALIKKLNQPGVHTQCTLSQACELLDQVPVPAAALEATGQLLFSLLDRGDFGREWRKLRSAGSIRTLLHIENHPSLRFLHALPWEVLQEPNPPDYLFLRKPDPFSRVSGVEQVAPGDDWPLRVLVVNGAEPGEPGKIGAAEEILALEKLFAARRADVEYELLEAPSVAEIVDSCRKIRPHVFHFIGHGTGGPHPNDHKLFIHSREPGLDPIPWELPSIRAELQGIAPRLVFLNSCRSAEARTDQRPMVSVTHLADTFLQIQALGVIGMQSDIDGALAVAFSAELYRSILDRQPIDAAVTSARLVLSRRTPSLAGGEWSLPVLKTRVLPDGVLPRPPVSHIPTPDLKRIVDRVHHRFKIRHTLHASTASQEENRSPHFIVVLGRDKCGKSHLLDWCAEMCRWRGFNSAHVKFDESPVDLFGALRWIRDGQRHMPPDAPRIAPNWALPAREFSHFNWELNHQLRGEAVPLLGPHGPDLIADEGILDNKQVSTQESLIESTVTQFRLALEAVARPAPLALFLDDIDKVEKTAATIWLPQWLFQPISSGKVSRVRVVIAMRKDDYDSNRWKALHDFRPAPTIVELDYFKPGEFQKLARYLCLQWSEKVHDYLNLENLPRLVAEVQQKKEDWNCDDFEGLNDLCKWAHRHVNR